MNTRSEFARRYAEDVRECSQHLNELSHQFNFDYHKMLYALCLLLSESADSLGIDQESEREIRTRVAYEVEILAHELPSLID